MGYKVIAGCGPTRDHANGLREQKAAGLHLLCLVSDVADFESTKAAFKKIEGRAWRRSTSLVNNAGITRDGVSGR